MLRHLLQFETLAESLLHDTFARWLHDTVSVHDLAVQLTRAMEDGRRRGPRGETLAPDRYVLVLHPSDLETLQREGQPEVERALAETVLALARRAGVQLVMAPAVKLVAAPQQPRCAVTVQAAISAPAEEHTLAQSADARAEIAAALRAPSAYLVVGGRRVVPLDRPVMTLGRRQDNDVIVDDPRVSRRHAQIRVRFGRYVLYDVGSHAGTRVNGVPVTECVLTMGDVISLGGCDLIYGEDETPPPPSEHTQALP
jgi:hypothetical protein